VPAGSTARGTGHGRVETPTLKAVHISRLDVPHARQAIKLTSRRTGIATGRTTRQTVYAITSLTSADATTQDLARLVREHWHIEAHGSAAANLAAIIVAIKGAGYLHILKAAATKPPLPKPSDFTVSNRTVTDIHGRRSRSLHGRVLAFV
jgi:hypothetical protein